MSPARRNRPPGVPAAPRLDALPVGVVARALEAAATPVMIADHAGVLVWVNDAFCRVSGYAREQVLGDTPRLLRSGHQSAAFYRELWATIRAGNVWEGDLIERRSDGSTWTAHQVITPFGPQGGPITHFIAVQIDVTETAKEREQIRRLAYQDSLTGLPNRRALLDRLGQEMAPEAGHAGGLALFYLDLDEFKPINDAQGHEVGDDVLIAVGERLRGAVRSTDTVARLGGDEFAVVLHAADRAELALLAQKLIDRVAEPYAVNGLLIRTSASLGISRYPADGTSPEALLRCADAAMYRAKAAGRCRFRFADAADRRPQAPRETATVSASQSHR